MGDVPMRTAEGGRCARPAAHLFCLLRITARLTQRAPWRMPRLRAALAALLIVTGATSPALSGAWMFEPGDGVAIITTGFTGSANAYDADGRLQPIPDYRKFELRAHVEYGITPWLTGVLKTEGRLESQSDTERSFAGAGGRIRLAHTDRMVMSAQAIAYTPGLDDSGLWLDGEPAAFDARLLIGRSFSLFGRPGFVDAQAGYRVTEGDAADEVHIDLTLGLKPTPRWMLLAQSFSTISVGSGPSYRYDKLQASVVRWIRDGIGLEVGLTGTIAGVSALQERGAFASLWYEF
ncbi:hypothetical protein [Amorphus sp. 3PC139-8]|uniref:hypothetical protein n=1 Tax=Amorphus sp. 3PC139-8 TaxID=2735676 RepID=UPI00345D35B9